jgi:hypothetical protein
MKKLVKKYSLTKSAFIFDLVELYKYDRNKYCEQLKREKRFTVPEETREYKNERYLEFKEKRWTKRNNRSKKVKIEQTSSIEKEEKQTKENSKIGEIYEEIKKNSMTQEQIEESIKIEDKIPDPSIKYDKEHKEQFWKAIDYDRISNQEQLYEIRLREIMVEWKLKKIQKNANS